MSLGRWIRALPGVLGQLAGVASASLASGCAAVALATRARPVVAAAMAYPACSFAVVTALYLWAAAGRNRAGYIRGTEGPRALAPLFWPYRVAKFAIVLASRALHGRRPVADEVAPGLYLGSWPLPRDLAALSARGVTHVVDLCAELPALHAANGATLERLVLPVLDRCVPSVEQAGQGARWAAERLARGQGVLIHCAFGRGRSAVVAAATLLECGRASDETEAFALLKQRRPVVYAGPAQRAIVAALAEARRRAH